jgi:hypothetical protein
MRELILAYVSNALWQVTIIGAVGLILGRRRRFSLLALTILACAIAPALTLLPSDAAPIVSGALPSVPARGAAIVVNLYLVGLAFCALRFLYTAFRAVRIVASSQPLSPGRRLSDLIEMPVTIGRTVFLPPSLVDDPRLLAAALAHEDAHVRRNDYLLHFTLELIALPLYFHPVTHLLRRAIAEARELACDDEAAARCGNREYAAALVEIASRGRGATGVSMAASAIERRVIALLEPRRRTRLRWQYALVLFIIAAACTRFDAAPEIERAAFSGHWTLVSVQPTQRRTFDTFTQTISQGPRHLSFHQRRTLKGRTRTVRWTVITDGKVHPIEGIRGVRGSASWQEDGTLRLRLLEPGMRENVTAVVRNDRLICDGETERGKYHAEFRRIAP